jgi:hypothetical protein
MNRKSSFSAVVSAAIIIFGALIWTGCGQEGDRIAAPLGGGGQGSSTRDIGSMASSTFSQIMELPSDMVLRAGSDAQGPDVLLDSAPVTIEGEMGSTRGYTLFSTPWPDSWASGSSGNTYSMNATTGVGRAYARCRPGNSSAATCGVRNSRPGTAIRWSGTNRSVNIVMYNNTRMTGTLVNGGMGATAGTYVDVKEYDSSGRYVQTFYRTIYQLTGGPVTNFDVNLYGRYVTVPFRTNYAYLVCVYETAWGLSGWSPPGSAVDINPARLGSIMVGY